ncbi:unnamed protein product [Anisakis simplex]|uniref:Uncharacterized protein n=1 Tax=Anisakis simplex TaxID=6269 RepID=A0A3P6R9B6_ANISI|nr:unnamed protein product [Anisakis simplex]
MYSKWGRRFRIALLGTTIIGYPVGSLLLNGPLLKYTLAIRYKDDEDVKSIRRLNDIIDSQYELFLRNEGRVPRDAVVTFGCSSSGKEMDSKAVGSLGVRSGLYVSLPFYARFVNVNEAMDYCKQHLQPLNFVGEPACVLWDSNDGREIANSFVLSDNALKFVILRDLYAYDGYSAYATRAGSWATFTTFSSFFTYWFHSRSIFGKTLLSFIGCYALFLTMAYFGAKQWYNLYRFMADVHADGVASRSSFEHCEGGKEYYWKMLKRNRLLREIIPPESASKVKLSGDIPGITTSILTRYDHLKDVKAEDDQLIEVASGDA